MKVNVEKLAFVLVLLAGIMVGIYFFNNFIGKEMKVLVSNVVVGKVEIDTYEWVPRDGANTVVGQIIFGIIGGMGSLIVAAFFYWLTDS